MPINTLSVNRGGDVERSRSLSRRYLCRHFVLADGGAFSPGTPSIAASTYSISLNARIQRLALRLLALQDPHKLFVPRTPHLLNTRIQRLPLHLLTPTKDPTQSVSFPTRYTRAHHGPAAIRLWPAIASLWRPKPEFLPVLILRPARVRYHNTFSSILRRWTDKYVSRSWLWRRLRPTWGQWPNG